MFSHCLTELWQHHYSSSPVSTVSFFGNHTQTPPGFSAPGTFLQCVLPSCTPLLSNSRYCILYLLHLLCRRHHVDNGFVYYSSGFYLCSLKQTLPSRITLCFFWTFILLINFQYMLYKESSFSPTIKESPVSNVLLFEMFPLPLVKRRSYPLIVCLQRSYCLNNGNCLMGGSSSSSSTNARFQSNQMSSSFIIGVK